jgi:signal transduction histidine kinase
MAAAGLIVLNVDDTEGPRYAKTRVLRRAGFDVTEASTGYEALRKVAELQPPIVLLDIALPDISGVEVCGIIKTKWPETMVLQLSATHTTSVDRIRVLEGGADVFLALPVEPEELVAVVKALLRIRDGEDALRRLNETLEMRVLERTRELANANELLQREIIQRQKAEASLVQSQKMEAIGLLTGGLAHDFNNLLTAVIGNLDLIRSRVQDDRIRRLADNASNAAQRGSRLTGQLLAFSRTQKLAIAPVDINALVRGMDDLLNQSLGPAVTIRYELADGACIALGDANQLELAILNLAINARDAMESGGTVTIRTAVMPADSSELSEFAECVEIDVIDDGPGMEPHVVARAFDPFFTTKPAGKGTGLGLSQVYGIAKQSGGGARLASRPGEGTTVTIRLPHAVADAKVAAPRDGGPVAGTRGETILLIDDDNDVRELVAELLKDLGYDVTAVDSGEAAFRALDRFVPQLMVLDFAMPGLNGAEVATVARRRHPDMRILFLSGYADTSALESAVDRAPLLHKPFHPSELAAAVRAALDAPAP